MFVQSYYQQVSGILAAVFDQEAGRIQQAGEMLAETFRQGGMLYVFGCGHSHMFAEELFYRAGGLAPVYPMFDTAAMLHDGAKKSSYVERSSGYAAQILERYPIGQKDCILLVSTSGINSLIIEMALGAKARGAKVIGISSLLYMTHASRQADGLHLPQCCDLCIDNHVPEGDAVVPVCQDGTKAGPVSTVVTASIVNAMALSACESLKASGVEPEVFRSGNCPGADEYNAALFDKYMHRVRHL